MGYVIEVFSSPEHAFEGLVDAFRSSLVETLPSFSRKSNVMVAFHNRY